MLDHISGVCSAVGSRTVHGFNSRWAQVPPSSTWGPCQTPQPEGFRVRPEQLPVLPQEQTLNPKPETRNPKP